MNEALKLLLMPHELECYAKADGVCQSFPQDSTTGTGILTSDLAWLLIVIDRLAARVAAAGASGIKPEIRNALIVYARDHKAAGSFVMACVENDLVQAATRADPDNLHTLPQIMHFIFNELPSPCWGSKEKVKAWLALPGPTALPDLRSKHEGAMQ